MRPALLAGLVVAVAPAFGFAQSGPYVGVVIDPSVKLRAGPSDRFPETGSLSKGTAIEVEREAENGWLAVRDIAGRVNSISWVQTQFIRLNPTSPLPQNVDVEEMGATLRAGQMGLAQPLNIQSVKVPAGTILTVIGPGVKFEGKTWYPVLPPVGDVRYLPKQAVRFEKPANDAFAVRDTTPAPAVPSVSPAGGTAPIASIPGAGLPATPVGKPGVDNPLWAQAEAAERDGRLEDAERLFFQLARQMNEAGGNHDIANLCYTRIHTLREKKRTSGNSSATATRPPVGEPARPTGGTQTSGGSLPPASGKDDTPRWTGPGRLVRTAITPVEGRQTYALESNPGVTVLYVVPAQGVDLARLIGKKVDVYGASYTRPGLTKPYVVATAVEQAQ